MKRGKTLHARLAAAAMAALFALSCAPAGPPTAYRFATNHDSVAALRCARNRLAIEGFEVLEATEPGPMVGLRRNDSLQEIGAPEWWRVDVAISRDENGRTLVETLAGSSRGREGPFSEPGVSLQAIVGKISASCTW